MKLSIISSDSLTDVQKELGNPCVVSYFAIIGMGDFQRFPNLSYLCFHCHTEIWILSGHLISFVIFLHIMDLKSTLCALLSCTSIMTTVLRLKQSNELLKRAKHATVEYN